MAMQYETHLIPVTLQIDDPNVVDQRQDARLSVSVQGGLSLNDMYYYVEMIDLSKSGARLTLENVTNAPEVGQSAILYLVWPFEIDSGLLSVEATIVRVEKNEIAVHFNHVPL